ncbi:kinesin motor domain-containing protein [Reticulomyxa filosa]|uniref:Kinesin motor domain-containing protein n=1 Tax=Reticulomyxa filosa TaxID=46433 RepID=X6NT85_RETFI|nr:kinesin motor domain-containing protein [Reticulomyxa filosa]|eukprot:ETO29485.1 kinesin motor domain-containing protein [Reticulomyxa filosa]
MRKKPEKFYFVQFFKQKIERNGIKIYNLKLLSFKQLITTKPIRFFNILSYNMILKSSVGTFLKASCIYCTLMNDCLDPELLDLTNELNSFGGSRNVKLGNFLVSQDLQFNGTSADKVRFEESDTTIKVQNPSNLNDTRSYEISRFYNSSVSNERIFAQMATDITSNLLDGFNQNIVTYGVVQSGKTTFLFGHPNGSQVLSCDGLFGTVVANIFRKIDEEPSFRYVLVLSCWEISDNSNEIKDLLQKSTSAANLSGNNKTKSSTAFEPVVVQTSTWSEVCYVWDMCRENSSNFKKGKTNSEKINSIENKTKPKYIQKEFFLYQNIEQNKQRNINLFSFNKMLHFLCNIHSRTSHNSSICNSRSSPKVHVKKNKHEEASIKHPTDIMNCVIHETLLNQVIAPIITNNCETLFIGFVFDDLLQYQSTLRTIQALSRYKLNILSFMKENTIYFLICN